MDSISGINQSMQIAAGSISVHSVGMQTAAHNIANISTAGFLPQIASYATGSHGIGVELQSVRKQTASRDAQTGIESAGAGADFTGTAVSGTDLAKEMTEMIATQHGIAANAAVIRSADEMNGSLLNIIA